MVNVVKKISLLIKQYLKRNNYSNQMTDVVNILEQIINKEYYEFSCERQAEEYEAIRDERSGRYGEGEKGDCWPHYSDFLEHSLWIKLHENFKTPEELIQVATLLLDKHEKFEKGYFERSINKIKDIYSSPFDTHVQKYVEKLAAKESLAEPEGVIDKDIDVINNDFTQKSLIDF
ncbi:hypothetical protein HN924_02520 [Candidatus Woesearchaeota archaeon]|jgi:hypothetical protein|nr:hypothetical protein [Candidatus Woesearchaeota archaeon]